MMMYRLLMFSMLIENLTKLIPRILLLILYAVSVAFLISHFNHSTPLSMKGALYHPVDSIQYLFQYMKWWMANKDHLGFLDTLWVIASFIIPYASYFVLRVTFKSAIKICYLWIRKSFSKLVKKHKKTNDNIGESNEKDLSTVKYEMMKAAERRIDEHLKKISGKLDK